MFRKILRKKIDFYQLLDDQADFMMDAVQDLECYIKTLDVSYAESVKRLEKQADKKRSELVQNLGKTFITPFDREDIFMLSKSLDDILDYYKTAVNEIDIYQIQPATELDHFAVYLKEGSTNICEAVHSIGTDPVSSMQYALQAKKCENKVEDIYRKSIALLLENDDIKYIIKMRELYRHLNNCADRIDQAADLISHILMKIMSS